MSANVPFTLDDWFTHISQIHRKRIELGLDRITRVADILKLRHFNCPVITVAGTNGKGSCTKTLESIYSQAGYKTALYTSPHLMHFNERVRIDNKNITDDDWVRAFEAIEAARSEVILSFFEFITLAALWLFQEACCDVVILEVGLGGRLDAVNCVECDVAVVTSIALDHQEWLGDNRESIAYEKASIARENKPLICGDENPPENIAKTVAEKKGLLHQIQRDFFYETANGVWRCYGNSFLYGDLPIPHLKMQNIATALATLDALKIKLPVSHEHIKRGIAMTQWPGRFEIDNTVIPCVLDVAHNPEASQWLAEQYRQLPRVNKTIAVVGMLKDKAMIETVTPLLPYVNVWYVCDLTSATEERGADGAVITDFLKANGVDFCHSFASVSDAMYALWQARCQQVCDRALIFGSFYTVAAAKKWLADQQ